MKSLRVISSMLLGLFLIACALAPAEVQGMVPPSVGDFLFSPDSLLVGTTASFTSLSRQTRGQLNLGGFTRIVLFAEDDFTEEWPKIADAEDGTLAIAPPLKQGVVGAVLKCDIGTGRGKYTQKGKLGYQNVDHEIEAVMAGYEEDQLAALKKVINMGGVAIGYRKNGKRVVYGTSLVPLEFEDTGDSGAKADDGAKISIKGKGTDGYGFRPPVLAPTVTIPLPV